jgi:ATP-dependent Lon protease
LINKALFTVKKRLWMVFFLLSNVFLRGSGMPTPIHKEIMKEFKRLHEMNTSHPDYSVFINYIRYIANLPWSKRTEETLDLEKARNVNIY